MDIFDVLTMIGGLSLFLFGMNVMGQSLKRRAGNSLKTILSKLSDNKFVGFMTGLLVTAAIQSSSATTVMIIGFVNSGLMTLSQSLNLIMGANVGTTITAWILSLSGISGGNFFLQMLKPSSFTPILAFIGVIFLLTGKTTKKRDTGMILLGFATLMFGLETMSSAVSAVKDLPAFRNLITSLENPVLGILVGAVLTAIIQSSSASVGVLQSLSMTGLVTFDAAIPVIMGMNIGACAPTLLSAVGTNTNAKRAAGYHLAFNIIGTVFWVIVFVIVKHVLNPLFLTSSTTPFTIAICHTTFKILCVALMAPINGLVEKFICRIIKESDKEKTVELDELLLRTPALALQRCHDLMVDMSRASKDSVNEALSLMDKYSDTVAEEVQNKEDLTDHYEDIIGTYLVKLSSLKIAEEESLAAGEYLKMLADLERIADHSAALAKSYREMNEKKISFSENASKELHVMADALKEISELSYKSFAEQDLDAAFKVEPLEQVIDYLKREIRSRHITRLQNGRCSIEAGFILTDILTGMERASDHCSNIAGCVIDASQHNLNLHETLNKYKKNNASFKEAYEKYMKKYSIEDIETV
ncbi:MAG: Na/Pi cotransporter family protein [Sphaerochaetaceae bacterium]|nr:Na/Pi cotransporter family protein [Sphaerochaetaceae bacterium]